MRHACRAIAALKMRVGSSTLGRKPKQNFKRRAQKVDRENATAPQATIPKGGMALAGRVSSELVAGLVVGAGSGWVLDRWLDTSPLLLVIMFFIGAAAGMLNLWRALSGRGMAAGYFEDYGSRSDKDGPK